MSCDCGAEHEGNPGCPPREETSENPQAAQSDDSIDAQAAGAGDFIPRPPPDEKVCDSYIGYKKIVNVALDVTLMYMHVVEKLKIAGDDFEEAFKVLDNIPPMQNVIIWEATSKKSERESRRLRLDADGWMRKSEYKKALLKYNGSVLTAPPESECLAHAYAGRAKALFYINDYRGCMENVDAALEANPSKIWYYT